MMEEIRKHLVNGDLSVEDIDYYIKKLKDWNYDYTILRRNEEILPYESSEVAFKRIMGFDFDPERYDIRPGDGAEDYGDNIVNTISIWDKKYNQKYATINQGLIDSLLKEKERLTATDEETVEDDYKPVVPYQQSTSLSSYDNLTKKELDDRMAKVWDEIVNDPTGEVAENDPRMVEYNKLIEADRKIKENLSNDDTSVLEEPAPVKNETPVVEEPTITENNNVVDGIYRFGKNDIVQDDLSLEDKDQTFGNAVGMSDEEIQASIAKLAEVPIAEPPKEEVKEPEVKEEPVNNVQDDVNKVIDGYINDNQEEEKKETEKTSIITITPIEDEKEETEEEKVEEVKEETKGEEPVKDSQEEVNNLLNDDNDKTNIIIHPFTGGKDESAPVANNSEDNNQVNENDEKINDNHDDVQDSVEPKENEVNQQEPSFRNYNQIIAELLTEKDKDENEYSIDLRPKDTRNINNGMISITKQFSNRLKQGNGDWKYKVTGFVSGLFGTLIFGNIKKASGKLYSLFHPKAVRESKQFKTKLNNLSKSDLEILRRGFTADNVADNRSHKAIIPLIADRLVRYIDEELCEPLRLKYSEISEDVATRFANVSKLEEELKSTNDSNRIAEINTEIEYETSGVCELIQELKDVRKQLNTYYEDGQKGIHGILETAKLSQNYSFDYGRRFSKERSTGEGYELTKSNGDLEEKLDRSLYNGNDKEALMAYGEMECSKIANTQEKGNKFFGKKSVGVYNWHLMPQQGNYADDPLLQYILGTIAVASVAQGIYKLIENNNAAKAIQQANDQNLNQARQVDLTNSQNINASQANEAAMEQIRATGRDLEARGEDYAKGLESMAYEDVVGKRSVGEYNAYDAKALGANYSELDTASHASSHEAWSQLEASLNDAKNARISGGNVLSNLQSIEQARQAVHSSFIEEIKNFRATMQDYCAKYPQYDYLPLQSSIDSIINNPSAINAMVDGMEKSVEAGMELSQAVSQSYSAIGYNVALAPSEIKMAVEPLLATAVLTAYIDRKTRDYKELENESKTKEIYKSVIDKKYKIEKNEKVEEKANEPTEEEIYKAKEEYLKYKDESMNKTSSDVIESIRMLNPDAKIKVESDDKESVIYSSIPGDKLVLPNSIKFDANNGVLSGLWEDDADIYVDDIKKYKEYENARADELKDNMIKRADERMDQYLTDYQNVQNDILKLYYETGTLEANDLANIFSNYNLTEKDYNDIAYNIKNIIDSGIIEKVWKEYKDKLFSEDAYDAIRKSHPELSKETVETAILLYQSIYEEEHNMGKSR